MRILKKLWFFRKMRISNFSTRRKRLLRLKTWYSWSAAQALSDDVQKTTIKNFYLNFALRAPYILLENKIYHKMQCEKLYNLHCKTYFNCVLFVFKKKQNYVSLIFEVTKIHRTEFCFFRKQKDKLYEVDCRAFHTAYCSMFCFFLWNHIRW